jgi:hypothetical protein
VIVANAEARRLVALSIETRAAVVTSGLDRETLRGLRVLALTYGGAVQTFETTHDTRRHYHDAGETWSITCTHPKNEKGKQAK